MFLSIPPLSIGRAGRWVLTGGLLYKHGTHYIAVPSGFETDLASIPRVMMWLVPQNGLHRAAAIVHDWLYVNLGRLPERGYTRAECDRIFLEAMKVLGVAWWRRSVMYAAVRVGGWVFWSK